MSSRNLLAPVLIACLLAVDYVGIAPAANAEAGGRYLKTRRIAADSAIEAKRRFKRRFRSVKVHLPVGPAYVYYDYPYYYSRGHYPTHIGGYVYYPYCYYRRYYGNRHSNWHRRCVANWRSSRGPGSNSRLKARRN